MTVTITLVAVAAAAFGALINSLFAYSSLPWWAVAPLAAGTAGTVTRNALKQAGQPQIDQA